MTACLKQVPRFRDTRRAGVALMMCDRRVADGREAVVVCFISVEERSERNNRVTECQGAGMIASRDGDGRRPRSGHPGWRPARTNRGNWINTRSFGGGTADRFKVEDGLDNEFRRRGSMAIHSFTTTRRTRHGYARDVPRREVPVTRPTVTVRRNTNARV